MKPMLRATRWFHVVYGSRSYYNHWDTLEEIVFDRGFDIDANVYLIVEGNDDDLALRKRTGAGISEIKSWRVGDADSIHR